MRLKTLAANCQRLLTHASNYSRIRRVGTIDSSQRSPWARTRNAKMHQTSFMSIVHLIRRKSTKVIHHSKNMMNKEFQHSAESWLIQMMNFRIQRLKFLLIWHREMKMNHLFLIRFSHAADLLQWKAPFSACSNHIQEIPAGSIWFARHGSSHSIDRVTGSRDRNQRTLCPDAIGACPDILAARSWSLPFTL
jgi:hypothetical protein